MPLCEECRVYSATMIIDDRWICEVCTSGIDPDGDEDEEDDLLDHDLDCRCDDCTETAIETAIRFDMGLLP